MGAGSLGGKMHARNPYEDKSKSLCEEAFTTHLASFHWIHKYTRWFQ